METAERRLMSLCGEAFRKMGLGREYSDRLREELREIDNQGEWSYFVDLYDKQVKYPCNENNLLIPYLLGIVSDFDITKPFETFIGEWPDIDTDFLKPVQKYLKNEWTPKAFGRECVCAIGNYNTFGLKSTFIDVAKLHGKDRDEILSLTTKLGLKDEDGKNLTLDRAIEEYPDLAGYCQRNPEVYEGVKKLLHRNRGMSVHAGGVIVSSKRIDDLVPLVVDKDGVPVSAWSEGQQSQDLGPMGLVKYDQLVISNLLQLAVCSHLVKERHGLDYISSDPKVNRDWSDTAYLNDAKAIRLANEGDLLGIFQFDSPGIRKLCKGNVTCFDDMMAFNALYRPGPLDQKMHELYIRRKNGKEDWRSTYHPLMQQLLDKTYGIMVYQEDVMRVFHAVGDIPMRDCYQLVKAISKKKLDKLIKYKEQFIDRGQTKLECSQEDMERWWALIESWAGYGFNKSHSCAYAYLAMRSIYLKAHFPIEFFTATLMCESQTEKIKEYMTDARRRGLRIEGINLNKSQPNFSIARCNENEEAIYYGFAKLKGLGEDVAVKIAENQPYRSFEDFLQRFGTDAKVLTALISLSVFGGDRVGQFKFYEHYKDWGKKIADRDKRHEQSRERHHQKLYEAIYKDRPVSEQIPIGFSDDHFEIYEATFESAERRKELEKFRNAYFKCIETYAKKKESDTVPHYSEFNPDVFDIDEKWDELLSSPIEQAEETYYGFRWTHPLERSPDYNPDQKLTFHIHRQAVEEGSRTNYVEVTIEKVLEKPTKSGGVYYQLEVSDVMDEKVKVNVWQDDFERFKEELIEGNLVKLKLDPPDDGFPTYKLNSPPRHLRRLLPTKTMDFRVVVLRKSEDNE